jgi:hypothetical protein
MTGRTVFGWFDKVLHFWVILLGMLTGVQAEGDY